jgi:nicotinamidase-related amidase
MKKKKEGLSMLVVIDMQNQILDENSQSFISDSPALIQRIAKRLQQARTNGEYILFTRDIPIDYKDTPDEEHEALQIVPELRPLPNEKVVKKYYFSIPPEVLLEIKEQLFKTQDEQKQIEVTGVETNICVLSNTIELQSAFPEADFFIDRQLVSGRHHESSGLKILQDFNVEVVDRTDN